ncbi:MAG TPA: 4-hydroxy-tetrahydrodipicolinate reductase [bacterium]|nr:4-hydroxy-tetrahydrodipicolinate reductase [bacterium]
MATDNTRRIALVGACGRMGRAITRRLSDEGFSVLPIEASGHPAQGKDHGASIGTGPSGVTVTTLADPALASCRAVVDFGSPESFRQALDRALAAGIPFLSGTTGLIDADRALMATAAKKIPLFHSANMSYGVAVIAEILPRLAQLTAGMEVAIVEAHHSRKKDAPSGTALKLGEILIAGRGKNDVAIHALRGGDVVGDHTITFFGDAERIELTHRAHDRDIFAAGAVRALAWLLDRKGPGHYSMQDIVKDTAR